MKLVLLMFACLFAARAAAQAGFDPAPVSARNTAATPAPRDPRAVPADPHWMERHESFVARARRGAVPLLFLGDSITDFWRSEDPQRGGKAVWDRQLAPLGAVNFGIGADRTQHLLWRIEHGEVAGIAPRAVVLLIGTNNLGYERDRPEVRRNTTAEAVAGITAVVTELLRRLPKTKLVLMALLPRGERDDPIRVQVATVNRALVHLAANPRIEWLDLGPAFLEPDGSINRELMPDLLHPSEKGYALWANALRGHYN